jgi:hypothetical protein
MKRLFDLGVDYGMGRSPAGEKVVIEQDFYTPDQITKNKEREARAMKAFEESGLKVGVVPEDIYGIQRDRFDELLGSTGAPESLAAMKDAIGRLQDTPMQRDYRGAVAFLDSLQGTNVAQGLKDVETPQEREAMLAKLNSMIGKQLSDQVGDFTQFAKMSQLEQSGVPSGILPLLKPDPPAGKRTVTTGDDKPIDTRDIAKRMEGLKTKEANFTNLIETLKPYQGKDVPGIGPLDSMIADSPMATGVLASLNKITGNKKGVDHLTKGQNIRSAIIQAAKDAIQAMGDTRPSDKDFEQAALSLSQGNFDEANVVRRLETFRRGIQDSMINAEASATPEQVQEYRKRKEEARVRADSMKSTQTERKVFQGKTYERKLSDPANKKESWKVVE